MTITKINKVWKYVNENSSRAMEEYFNTKIIDTTSDTGDFIDLVDHKGNEYTLCKSDIEAYSRDYLTLTSDYLQEILENMVKDLNPTSLEEQDEHMKEYITELLEDYNNGIRRVIPL